MLNLDANVDVIVSVGAVSAARNGYNVGLIIGASDAISAANRIKAYTSADAMLDDGFTSASVEYLAAQKYFSQEPAPKKVMIGVKAEGETFLQAVTACCAASTEWYACYCCGAVKADIAAVAAYIETQNGRVLVFDTEDSDVPAGTSGNVFNTLKGLSYARSIGVYSESDYAGAAMMGYAMGANNGTVNSAYTLKFKTLKGILSDDLTTTQVTAIKADNGNVYIKRGGTYTGVEDGVMANGDFFDHRLSVDQLAYNVQMAVCDLLYNTKTKIPQTESGMTQIKTAIAAECDKAVKTGFLAPGVWNEPPVLNLETGATLSNGYFIQSEPVDGQTAQERASRQAPAVYISVKEAGAVHGVTIKVIVAR